MLSVSSQRFFLSVSASHFSLSEVRVLKDIRMSESVLSMSLLIHSLSLLLTIRGTQSDYLEFHIAAFPVQLQMLTIPK